MINFAEKRRFMYRKKIPFDIDCGVKIAMEVIGGKWKMHYSRIGQRPEAPE